MKSIIYLAFAAFWHITTVWAAHPPYKDGTDGQNAVRVTYTNQENKEINIDLAVSTDGQLASHELFHVQVLKARVESDVHVTCFFYELYQLMHPFSTTKPLELEQVIPSFRLYCYDSSAEEKDKDTFVVFVEREYEEKELLRVPLMEGEEMGQLDLIEEFGDVGENVKSLALIDVPKIDDASAVVESGNEYDSKPGCIAVVSTTKKHRMGGVDELTFSFEKRKEVYPSRPLYELFCYMK